MLAFYEYKNKINDFNRGYKKKGSLILTFQKRKTPEKRLKTFWKC